MNQSYLVLPPELVEQWRTQPEFAELGRTTGVSMTQSRLRDIAAQAAQWGADQELEACCEWLGHEVAPCSLLGSQLRAARRPKPPSLKEQALSEVAGAVAGGNITPERGVTIRRALEQLPDAL